MWLILFFAIGLADAESPAYVTQAKSIQEKCQKDTQRIYVRLEKEQESAANESERRSAEERAYSEIRQLRFDASKKVLELSAPNASETAAVDLLVWAAIVPSEEARQPAVELLATHHLTHESTIRFALRHHLLLSPAIESLLRAQLDAIDPTDAQHPKLLIALAESMQSKAAAVARFQIAGPAELELYEKRALSRSLIDQWKSLDSQRLQDDAVALFTRLEKEHGQKPIREGSERTFADLARSAIFEIQHLGIGKQAPEIEGKDLAGRPMKLSDFRGKVVMLTFWASWCGPCMALVPHEKEIVERYKDSPFALIGINGDSEKAKAEEAIQKEGITWRSFACGEKGPDGELPRSWNVSGWPTIYLIDSKGTIRAKDRYDAALDEELEKLIKEAAGK